MKPDELRFGTAGIPNTTILKSKKNTTAQGIEDVKQLGLGCLELEFVQGVYVNPKNAPLIKEASTHHNILLTCHSPYFINLNARETTKIDASKQRILQAARALHQCGGWSACFHAAYYLGMDPMKVYENVKHHLKDITTTLRNEGITTWIRPELTGKPTQWGDAPEIITISSELEGVQPCIDFAHYHARHAGKNNTYEEFAHLLRMIEHHLGKEGLQNMHIHTAGIEYTQKGERRHLNLAESDINYNDLVRVWKDFKIRGVVISESPNVEKDALLLQQLYREGGTHDRKKAILHRV